MRHGSRIRGGARRSVDEREFRSRAAGILAVTALVAVAPFGIASLTRSDHVSSGIGTLALVAALCAHAWATLRAPRLEPWTGVVLVPLCLAALVLSLREHGVGALFWCFPAVLGYCCLLSERAAWAACALTFVVVLGLASRTIAPDVVLRAAATLLVVTVFAGTMVRVSIVQANKLRSRGETDSLTGLANRHSLDETLDAALAGTRGPRTADAAGAGGTAGPLPTLLALDIDHFKVINDTCGHAAGDAVLRATGAFLREELDPGDGIWRTGGEEFLVLLRDPTPSGATERAHALVGRYPERVRAPGGSATFSAGLARLRPGEDADSWMRRADRALYRAKAAGRNRLDIDGEIGLAQPGAGDAASDAAPPAQPSSAAESSGSSSNRSPTSP